MLSISAVAAECPDRIALIHGDTALTYAELADRVREAVEWLQTQGVRGGEGSEVRPVPLIATNELGTLEVLYALIELGVPALLIHPRLTPAERAALLDDLHPTHLPCPLVVDARWREAKCGIGAAIVHERIVSPISEERCLAVLFTSGTTGRPKGVMLSRRAFLASARASAENLGWLETDRWLLCMPVAHVGGLSIVIRCLLARRAVVVPQSSTGTGGLDTEALIRAVEKHRVTLLSLVPTVAGRLLERAPSWDPPPAVRGILLGGAAASTRLLERAAERRWPLLSTYGLTEACSQVTTQACGTVNRGQLGAGRPIAGTEVRVVGGRIQVRGPTLLSGYYPPGRFPLPLDREGWFTTDDYGHIDGAGRLHVRGRSSELIVTGGENVYPAEIEPVLEACPGVVQACVFGVDDEQWGQLVAAALVAEPSRAPSDAALVAHVRARLAPHKQPRRVAFLTELCFTGAGKLDRRASAARARPALRVLGP